MVAIDACEGMLDAEKYELEICALRVLASYVYQRDDDEIGSRVSRYLEAAGAVPIGHRIRCVYGACATSARLAATYLPPLIAEARTALAAATTDHERRWLAEELATALKVCARLGVDDSIE